MQAAKIPVMGNLGSQSGILTGKYAYAVLDEGVKARVNLGSLELSSEFANATTLLGAGQRPVLNGISGIVSLCENESAFG